ncbi:MAG: trigger factor [Chlorobi bacterium]|nr:trigger factor [Chlorobiota bacterium]
MNISKENTDGLTSVLRVTVGKKDYEEKVNETLKDYRKKANMPGFRPGKVPMGLIKKMYGQAVLVDEVNKLVSESLSNYLQDNKIDLLGEPLPSDDQKVIDFDNQEEFEFSFDIAEAPELDFTLNKKDKIPYHKIAVTDEMVEQQIKALTSRFGKQESVETISDKSLVKGNFVQVDENGNEIEDGIKAEDSVLSMSVVKDEEIKNKLLAAKVGDTVVFNPKKAFPDDTELSYLLKIDKEVAANVDSDFKFTITDATEFIDPELNQELFDQIYGKDVVKSEEEFKNKVKEELEQQLALDSDYLFFLDAKKKLLKKFKAELPEEFLKRWITATNKDNKELTPERIDQDMPLFLDDLKWQLIKNKLIKDNDLKLEDQDVIEYAKKSAKMQFAQYGLTNVPDEHIESYAMDMLKNEEQARQIYDGAMHDKIISFIKDTVKVDEKEVSREEFNKLIEKK